MDNSQLQRHIGSSGQKKSKPILGHFYISKGNIPICFGKKDQN